jgi:hypothetical protein
VWLEAVSETLAGRRPPQRVASQAMAGIGRAGRKEQNGGRRRCRDAGRDAGNNTTSGGAAHEDFPS